MNRKKRQNRLANKSKGQPIRPRKYLHLVALGLALAVLSVGALYLLHVKPTTAQSTAPPAAQESAGPPKAKAELESLKGRWQRPDGGYLLEIREIDTGGKMTAAYFNPRPINVSQAEAALDGAVIKVFIELRDVNYPGATYHLTYEAERDQLRGVYFQPALQQRFDVFFVRMN